MVWTVIDSAMRTQLSGFDASRPALAFSADGMLAGGTPDGAVWFWRNGPLPGDHHAAAAAAGDEKRERARSRTAPEPSGRGGDGAVRRERRRAAAARRRARPRQIDRPTSLAFDVQGRLVAHNSQGLRIWPAGPISAQATPTVQLPLPGVGGALKLTPIARHARWKDDGARAFLGGLPLARRETR